MTTPAMTFESPRRTPSFAFPLVLIAIGALWLLANLGAFTFINWRFAWPLVLIAAGAALLVRRVRP